MIAKFFEALYGDMPDDAHLEVWSKDDGARYFRTFSDAASYARSLPGNAYYGVCLCPPTASNHRATAQSVLYAPALWVDIDVKSPHHSKENLPPHDAAAYNILLEALPLAPSAIIYTGGGLHAYWFLHEPLSLEDDADRVQFASVLKGWQSMLRKAMRQNHWDLDATHDLARIMRIPGSYNHNAGKETSIGFLDDSMRYSLEDFAQFTDVDLSAAEAADILSFDQEFRHIHIIPRRGHSSEEPLASRVSLLCDMQERFRASYEGRNPLLTDDSMSTLDASLAFWMAFYDTKGDVMFSDQDIADVLVDTRVKHARKRKDLSKATRVDYLQRTIAHARKSALESVRTNVTASDRPEQTSPFQDVPATAGYVKDVEHPVSTLSTESPSTSDHKPEHPEPIQAVDSPPELQPVFREALRQTPQEGGSLEPPMPPAEDEAWNNIPLVPEAKKEAWAAIGAQMGFWFHRAVLYINTEPKELRFVVQPRVGGQTACVILTTESLLSKGKVKSAFFDATGRVPTCLGGDAPLKPYQWELVAQDIMEACPRDKVPEEATEEGLLRICLKQYVAAHLDASHRASSDLEEAAASGRPFISGGHIHINVTAFAQYLRVHGITEWGSATKIAKGFLKLKMRKRRCPYKTRDGGYRAVNGYSIPDSMELELANELPVAETPETSATANIQ